MIPEGAEFQVRFIPNIQNEPPVAGHFVATHDGNMYIGTESGWIPYSSVITVVDVATLNAMKKYPDKIYRVGNALYRYNTKIEALRTVNRIHPRGEWTPFAVVTMDAMNDLLESPNPIDEIGQLVLPLDRTNLYQLNDLATTTHVGAPRNLTLTEAVANRITLEWNAIDWDSAVAADPDLDLLGVSEYVLPSFSLMYRVDWNVTISNAPSPLPTNRSFSRLAWNPQDTFTGQALFTFDASNFPISVNVTVRALFAPVFLGIWANPILNLPPVFRSDVATLSASIDAPFSSIPFTDTGTQPSITTTNWLYISEKSDEETMLVRPGEDNSVWMKLSTSIPSGGNIGDVLTRTATGYEWLPR